MTLENSQTEDTKMAEAVPQPPAGLLSNAVPFSKSLAEAYGAQDKAPLGAPESWREDVRQWAKDRLLGTDIQKSAITGDEALTYARSVTGISTTDLAALRAAYIEGKTWNGVGVTLGMRQLDADGLPVDSPDVGEGAKAVTLAALACLARA